MISGDVVRDDDIGVIGNVDVCSTMVLNMLFVVSCFFQRFTDGRDDEDDTDSCNRELWMCRYGEAKQERNDDTIRLLTVR